MEGTKEPIGLIAGAGRFPMLLAKEARRMGHPVVVLGIQGVTEDALAAEVSQVHLFKLGQLDKPIQILKAAGVRKAIMAGKIQHVSIFGGVMPDMRAVKVLARLKDKRADTILKAVADEFAKDGIEFISSATYLQHLVPEPGPLTKRAPDAVEEQDIALGWKAAKAIAGVDAGQSVVVSNGAVVALEGLEGTDACIRRAHELTRADGKQTKLIIVKVAKPRQDFRFDLPVIGLDTVGVLQAAGASVLAIEARKSVFLDKERLLEEADKAGIAIVALDPARMEAL